MLDDIAPANDANEMQAADMPEAADPTSPKNKQKLLYCERFVEFLTDLLSQLPTRRFIRTLLEDRAILIKCRMSALFQHPQGDSHNLKRPYAVTWRSALLTRLVLFCKCCCHQIPCALHREVTYRMYKLCAAVTCYFGLLHTCHLPIMAYQSIYC